MMFKFILFLAVVLALTVYFLPAIIGMVRRHVNAVPVFLTNLYFGWTVVGWIVALIWSLSAGTYQPSGASVSQVVKQTEPLAAEKSSVSWVRKILMTVGVLVLVIVVLMLVSPTKTATDTQKIKQGVPMTADELFKNVPLKE